MKEMNILRSCALAASLLAATTVFWGCSGCTTTQKTEVVTKDESGNPVTNIVTTKVFDKIKTDQVKAAIDPLISGAARRVIANSPQHSDEIASYFRNVGTVFCKMRDTGQFSPEFLIAEADKATATLQSKVDPYILDIKNTGIALYKIFYAERVRADLPPEKFMWNVSELFCEGINRALLDAGKPGVAASVNR